MQSAFLRQNSDRSFPYAIHLLFVSLWQYALGYRMRFRNTGTTLIGSVDSYRKVTLSLDRSITQDVKASLFSQACAAFSFATTLSRDERRTNDAIAFVQVDLNPRSSQSPSFGMRVSFGGIAPIVQPRSPITLGREILSVN